MELENNVEVSDESTKVDAESFYEQTDEAEGEETTSESESEESKESSETIVDGNIESEESGSKDEDGSKEEDAESTESKDDKEGSFELALTETHLSEELIGEFAKFAKENDLSQEVAQKVLEQNSKVIDSYVSQAFEQQAKLHESWKQETFNDPELGGDNLLATSENSKRALEEYGTPELRTMLRDGNFGNNIEVVRLFNKIGKAMGEDKMVFGSGKTKTERSFEDKFYNAKK